MNKEFELIEYPLGNERIDNSLSKSWNSTIFHESSFLLYHPKEKFNLRHFSLENNGNISMIVPGEILGKHLVSPRGASWGGPAFIQKSLKNISELTGHFVNRISEAGINKITFTIPSPVENSFIDNRIEFALLENQFKLIQEKPTSIIRTDSANPENNYSSQSRRLLRKSQNSNLLFSNDFNLDEFYPIMEKNLMKFNTKPTHSKEELLLLKEKFPKRIELFCAIFEDKVAAGVLTFQTSPRSKLAFYINQNYEFSNLGCMTFCLHNLLLDSYNRGIDYVDLGVSMDLDDSNDENLSWSLLNFKESFGSVYFSRKTFGWESNG